MSKEPSQEPDVKRMADLLRQGATLTELACPACASPLFRLRNGDVWCAKCEKKVIVVREGEDTSRILGSMALDSLEATLLEKIQKIQDRMQHEEDAAEIKKLDDALSGLLDNLERTRKTKRA